MASKHDLSIFAQIKPNKFLQEINKQAIALIFFQFSLIYIYKSVEEIKESIKMFRAIIRIYVEYGDRFQKNDNTIIHKKIREYILGCV